MQYQKATEFKQCFEVYSNITSEYEEKIGPSKMHMRAGANTVDVVWQGLAMALLKY